MGALECCMLHLLSMRALLAISLVRLTFPGSFPGLERAYVFSLAGLILGSYLWVLTRAYAGLYRERLDWRLF